MSVNFNPQRALKSLFFKLVLRKNPHHWSRLQSQL